MTVEEKKSLEKILFESNSQLKPSLSDQMSQILANTPKEPSLSDILEKVMNPQVTKNDLLPMEQNKKTYKPSNAPRNPKYLANNKNFAKLIDSNDAHESRITELEDAQVRMQNELPQKVSLNSQLQSSDKPQTSLEGFFLYFFKDIHWKSFAVGVLTLAIIFFFIYLKL